MRGLAVALGLFAVASLPASAADIAGRYKVQGVSPDKSTYTGTAEVKKTGEKTFRVTWSIAGTKFVGTGIGQGGFIAVAYKADENDTGICLLATEDGETVDVAWTYSGGKSIGGERWTR